MASRELTPHHVDLIYSAALASFWRRRALHKFLQSCGIARNFLSSWHADETKRDFLDRVFERLLSSDKGPAVIRAMGRALAEQTAFADLEGWEDSTEKLIRARDAIDVLKKYQDDQAERERQEKQRIESRQRYEEERERVTRSQMTLQKLTQRLNELTGQIGTQKAGYDFQDWFFDFLDFSEIVNRRPYVHDGRQIDGSMSHDGTTYLVELKFTAEQAGAPDVDSFLRKVTTKADNTMGIMVSMAGFSGTALKEASGPKTPLLLLDHAHVFGVLTGVSDFRSVIERVRRHASQTGDAFLPIQRFSG